MAGGTFDKQVGKVRPGTLHQFYQRQKQRCHRCLSVALLLYRLRLLPMGRKENSLPLLQTPRIGKWHPLDTASMTMTLIGKCC